MYEWNKIPPVKSEKIKVDKCSMSEERERISAQNETYK